MRNTLFRCGAVAVAFLFSPVQSVLSQHILFEDFSGYSETWELGNNWSVNEGTESELVPDPFDPDNNTVFVPVDTASRRVNSFDAVTPTDEDPVSFSFRFYDDDISRSGRQWMMLSDGTDERILSLGIHTSDSSGKFQLRELTEPGLEGRDWIDLDSNRREGWSTLQIILYSDTLDVIINGEPDSAATDLSWGGGEFTTIMLGPNVTSATAAYYDMVVLTTDLTYDPHPENPIIITDEPEHQAAGLGDDVTFSVVATGEEPLTYRWRKDKEYLSDGDRISGSETDTLTIDNVDLDDRGSYSVVILSDADPGGAISRGANLSLELGETLLLRYNFDESATGNEDALDIGAAPPADGVFEGPATRTDATPGGFSEGAVDFTQGDGLRYIYNDDAEKLDELEQFTLTTWINLQAPPSGNLRLLAKQGAWDGATSPGFTWNVNDPPEGERTAANFGLRLFVGGDAGFGHDLVPGHPVALDADDKWVFVAVTYDGTVGSDNVNYYSGGDDSGAVTGHEGTTTANGGTTIATDARFMIGHTDAANTADTAPRGFFDDARVYAGILSQEALEEVRLENLTDGLPPVGGYEEWRESYFEGDDLDDSVSGPMADASGDGMKNLLKYALGLDPTVATTDGRPLVDKLESGEGDHYLTLTFTRPPQEERPDITYVVKAATELGDWTAETVEEDSFVNEDGSTTEVHRATTTIDEQPGGFLLLEVVLDP